MRTAKNLSRVAGLLGLALVFIAVGCGRKEVSARVQPAKVIKWKHLPEDGAGIPKGIVVEHHGDEIRARFCDLRPGKGFAIDSTLSHGTYLADRKMIVFPLGMPDAVSLEQWLEVGGPHLSVPFDPRTPDIAAELHSSGASQSFQFARYQD
jgi:hypothetical protein